MAQKVTVVLEDDLTGGPAKQTVRFAFDGTDYEIDLNAKNAAAFGKQLTPYLEHARRAENAACGADDEIACLARQVAIDQGEPPDLGLSRAARYS